MDSGTRSLALARAKRVALTIILRLLKRKGNIFEFNFFIFFIGDQARDLIGMGNL